MKKTILLLVFLAGCSVKAVESNSDTRDLVLKIRDAFDAKNVYDAYKEKIDTIDGKIENTTKKINETKKEIDKKKQEKSNKNQEMFRHDGEISNMHSEKEKLDARIKTLKEKNHFNDWEQTNKDIEAKIIATQNELNEAKSATADLFNRRNEARQQRTQMENNKTAESNRLDTELHAAQKQLAGLQKAQNTHTPKLGAQQKKVQKIQSDIDGLGVKIKNNEQRKAELSVSIVEQTNSVTVSEMNIGTWSQYQKDTKQKAIATATASLQKEIEDLQTSASIMVQDPKAQDFGKIFLQNIKQENKERDRAQLEEQLKSLMKNLNTWHPEEPFMQKIKSDLERSKQGIVQETKEKQEAQKALTRLIQDQKTIEHDQEKIHAQLKQANDDLISATNGLNTLGDGQQPMQQPENLIRQAEQVVTLKKREMDNRSKYTPGEQAVLDAEKESARVLSQNQALCQQKTKVLKTLKEKKAHHKNACDQETKARKNRINALELEINNQPKQLETLQERRERLGGQTKKIEEEISRLIKERDNGQKILDALHDEKVQAKKNMNALSQSLDQIQPDIQQYVKGVAHLLTDSIVDLDCKGRAVYMHRLWAWALKEQSGIGDSSGEIYKFCGEVQAKLKKAEDCSLVEQEVQLMLRTIPVILSVGQKKALLVNGGTMKTSSGHACGGACNVCIEKEQPINKTGFAHIVSVVDKVNSLHPTACRIAKDIQGVDSVRPLMEQGMQFDLALACWNVAKADNLDDRAKDSLVSAVVWACQNYNSTEYKPAANNPILMRAESYINSPSFQVQLKDMYDEDKKVWQWLKESVDKDKEMVARMKRV